MKTTTLTAALSAALLVSAASAPVPAAAGASALDIQPILCGGSATVAVTHPWTGEPLAGMPLTLVRLDAPEEAAYRPIRTGRNGVAHIRPLEDGAYEVYVQYNNLRSASVKFEIIDGSQAFVTITFNPDLD